MPGGASGGCMTVWRRETRVCPVCENRIRVVTVDACGSHGADSDFRPHYWGTDPLEQFIHACRDCGFAGTDADFREGLSETVIRRIRKFLTPRTRDLARAGAPFFRFEFAALIYEWQDRSSLEVGDAFLRAAWVARLRENR